MNYDIWKDVQKRDAVGLIFPHERNHLGPLPDLMVTVDDEITVGQRHITHSLLGGQKFRPSPERVQHFLSRCCYSPGNFVPQVMCLGSAISEDRSDISLYSTQCGSEGVCKSSNIVCFFIGHICQNEKQILYDTLSVSPQTMASKWTSETRCCRSSYPISVVIQAPRDWHDCSLFRWNTCELWSWEGTLQPMQKQQHNCIF